jgi:hypothetical protein
MWLIYLAADLLPRWMQIGRHNLMPLTTRVRPRIGDIIEIPIPDAFAYAQFTHRHEDPPKYGALLRILPGLYKVRPDDFSRLVAQTPSFSTFFPLGAACHRGIVRVVAEEPIPAHTLDFPTFRNSHRDRTGRRCPLGSYGADVVSGERPPSRKISFASIRRSECATTQC